MINKTIWWYSMIQYCTSLMLQGLIVFQLQLNTHCLLDTYNYIIYINYMPPLLFPFNYLDCVSPDLMRSLRMWKESGFHQGQLRMVSFSQISFTINSSPMSTSVVSKKEMVVLVFKAGLQGRIKHIHTPWNIPASPSTHALYPTWQTEPNLHNEGHVLLLSRIAIQGNLHGLISIAYLAFAEEMDFNLVVEN